MVPEKAGWRVEGVEDLGVESMPDASEPLGKLELRVCLFREKIEMGDQRDQVNSGWETELPAMLDEASVPGTTALVGGSRRDRGAEMRD